MRLVAVLLLVACGTPSGPPQPYVAAVGKGSGATADEIVATVTELRNDDGTVRCFLYDDAADFPDSQAHIVARAVALPVQHQGTCRFSAIARDRDYAIVILHDENNDNIFQKNALGMPKEGYGFSNNPHIGFSAPSFSACKFHFASGPQALTIATLY